MLVVTSEWQSKTQPQTQERIASDRSSGCSL